MTREITRSKTHNLQNKRLKFSIVVKKICSMPMKIKVEVSSMNRKADDRMTHYSELEIMTHKHTPVKENKYYFLLKYMDKK